MSTVLDDSERVNELDEKEAWALFDELAKRYVGVSGYEFLQEWEGGKYRDSSDEYEVMSVAMMLPLVQKK